MRKKIIAANWKMNLSPLEAKTYCQKFPRLLKKGMEEHVILFPPALLMSTACESLDKTKINLGGQNCHWEASGAYTGENSPKSLLQLGAQYCLVGHSERRHLFKESIEETALKINSLQNIGLIPMLCVGETLAEREAGTTEQVILDQIEGALKQADLTKQLVIAYEPVWAIGTGKVATPDLAQQAHQQIRNFLKKKKIENTPILYGGSVKPDNAALLLQCPDIDGFLVGGASLDPEGFAKICLLALNA